MSGTTPLPQSPQDQNVQTANQITSDAGNAVRRYPDVVAATVAANNPNITVGAVAGADLTTKAQSVVQHQINNNSGGILHDALRGVEDVASKVTKTVTSVPGVSTLLQWANKPLQEIQKDYKFISAVYAKHGVAQGLLATLGVLGAATAGAVFSGGDPLGAVAGADLAMAGERNLFGRLVPQYHDALMMSNDPNYKVSAGRELATGLSNIPGLGTLRDTQHGIGQFISGATDAAADLEFDPVIIGGKVSSGISSGRFIQPAKDAEGKLVYQEMADGTKKGILIPTEDYAQSASGIQKWLIQRAGVATSPQQLLDTYDLYKSQNSVAGTVNRLVGGSNIGNVGRALDDIGATKDPTEIATKYPQLANQVTQTVIKDLAKTSNGREAAQVLAQSLHSADFADNVAVSAINNLVLPTRTFAQALAGNVAKKIYDAAGDTTANEERNLLLPKKVYVTDAEGNRLQNADGSNQTKILQGGLLSGDITNALAGKLRTFTGYKALSVNSKLIAQSGDEIDFNDPSAFEAIYNMARYALPRNLALEKTSKIVLNPDLNEKMADYGELLKEIVKTAGVRDDSNLLDHVMSFAQRVTMNGAPVKGMYAASHNADPLLTKVRQGVTISGDEVPFGNSAPWVPDQAIPRTVQNAGIWTYHEGGNGIIDFKALRKEVANANVYNRLYNSADDFFSYYTEKIFAPLTLLTSGFGIRVASNEALHQIIRFGLGDYLENFLVGRGMRYGTALDKAKLREAASKVTEAATDEDINGLKTGKPIRRNSVTEWLDGKAKEAALLAKHPVGAVAYKITPYFAKDKLEFIHKFQQQYAGMTLPAASASNHLAQYGNAIDEEIDQGMKQLTHSRVPGQNFYDLFSRQDPQFNRLWALGTSKLRNEQMARDIAKDYLDHVPGGLKHAPEWDTLTQDQKWQKIADLHTARVKNPDLYKVERAKLVGLKYGDLDDFASNQVSDFRRQTTGADGTEHLSIMRNIKDGKPTYTKDLNEIPVNQQPLAVIGRVNTPTTINPMERIIQTGYRTFSNPVIDSISREPIFNHYAFEQYRQFKPMVDSGLITDDDAVRLAAQNGAKQMIPLIHNPPLRSQFAMIHRNVMPFYFAQEQALKRVGRLIQTNPQAFRDFQMINQGLNNPGFVHTDSNGTKYIVYPLIGEFGNSVARGLNALGFKQFTGLPSSVTGSTSSLLSVLPEMKLSSIGPFANLGLTEITKMFPALAPADNALTGGYPATDWINALLPNSSIRDMYNGLSMDDKETAVHNSFLSAVAAAYYHGSIPDGSNGTLSYAQMPPAEQQAIMDKIEHNARTNLFVKGILAFFLPLSPNVSNDYYNKDLQTLRSEFVTMTLPKSQGGQGLDLKTATAEFMNKYGDRSVVYTTSKTTSGAGGAALPLADSTLQWLAANKNIMTSNPNGAAYLVPQVAGTPDSLKIEQKLLTTHLRETLAPKDFLTSVFVAKGWSDLGPSLASYENVLKSAQATGNRVAQNTATTVWKNVVAQYGASNPIWYADYSNPTRTEYAKKALTDLQTLNAKNQLGNSPQAPGIQQLLASYADYHALLQQNTIDHGLRFTPEYSRIKNAWFDYVTNLAVTNPELANVINGVFKKVT